MLSQPQLNLVSKPNPIHDKWQERYDKRQARIQLKAVHWLPRNEWEQLKKRMVQAGTSISAIGRCILGGAPLISDLQWRDNPEVEVEVARFLQVTPDVLFPSRWKALPDGSIQSRKGERFFSYPAPEAAPPAPALEPLPTAPSPPAKASVPAALPPRPAPDTLSPQTPWLVGSAMVLLWEACRMGVPEPDLVACAASYLQQYLQALHQTGEDR